MSVPIRIFAMPASRPCRFCLSIQEDSAFADFDVDETSQVFLRRISFDGYGCCSGDFKKMDVDDARFLIKSVDSGTVEGPKIERLLRTYLAANTDGIWSDALAEYELIEF